MTFLSYVDTYIKEGTVQEDLADLLSTAGWVISKTFYKVAFNGSLLWTVPSQNDFTTNIVAAKHVILSNPNLPKTNLGVAIIGSMNPLWSKVTSKPTGGLNAAGDFNAFATWVKTEVEKVEPLPTDTNRMTKFFSPAALYFYIIENIPSVAEDSWTALPAGDDLERTALDVEVWEGGYKKTSEIPSYKVVYFDPELGAMQSPVSKCILRFNKSPLEDLYNETYDVFQNNTNWWFDSDISVKGFIDTNAAFFVMHADTVPAWEDNVVPSIPFYLGKVEPFQKEDGTYYDYESIAFFAGSCPESTVITKIPEKDYDDYLKSAYQTTIFPLLKDYPRHPSNGVDTVTIQRAKQGARYQAYFLSWNTAPNAMPPDRQNKHITDFTGDGFDRDYPRAWNNFESEEFKYQFNPSRYSDKIHTSKIYVAHPEEGLVGSLYHAIGLSPIGIMSGKIRVLIDPCAANKYEYYRYYIVDGVSPLTKRPGTVYRPIGLGLRDDTIV